jgi:beta-lactamase superfamily II metal-dependent hydrolase
MSDAAKLKKDMKSNTLAVIVLNVGDGDAIIIKFPSQNGKTACAVVDCYNANKTIAALEALKPDAIPFICATHPHSDHIKGMKKLLEWCIKNITGQIDFWDSGFRHVSKTHYDIIRLLQKHHDKTRTIYPTSGYETIINKVRVLVLSPSIRLKNRYDTFGTNINNGSIVLKLEYPPKDIAPYYLSEERASEQDLSENERLRQNTVILSGDAQFDAWARITDEFPELQRTQNRGQMINPDVIKHRPLRCQVLKVPHHMSKHGISLEVIETLLPRHTIASCANKSKHGFPHELTVMAVEEIRKKKEDRGIRFTGHWDKKLRSGTVVALFRGSNTNPKIYSLGDTVKSKAPL